jgi:Ca2+-dependent lipid-binding protein
MEASPIVSNEMVQRIALYISCRKLKDMDITSKSDPYVEIYMKERNAKNWGFIGKTEIIMNNLNPDFATPIECNYYFEKE